MKTLSKYLLYWLGAGVLFLLLQSSACRPIEVPPTPAVAKGYPDSIARIVANSCMGSGCHQGSAPAANLDLSTWEKAFAGSDAGAVIVPYNANWSHFFQHVNTFTDLGLRATPIMPYEDSTLSREDVLAIKNWILAGARSDSGAYYWQAREETASGKLFTLCQGSDLIAVSDLASNCIMRYVDVGKTDAVIEAPHYLTVSPDQRFLYTTMIEAGTFEKFRTDTYERVGEVTLGPQASIIALRADGKRAIVTHWNDGIGAKLSLVNTEDMTVLDQLAGFGIINRPHGLAVTADFDTAYVTDNSGNFLLKVATDGNSFTDYTPVPLTPGEFPQSTGDYQPYWVTLSPDGKYYAVACSKKNEVRIYRRSDDALTATVVTGVYPRQMIWDATGGNLLVACANEPNVAVQGSIVGCISVIETLYFTEIGRVYNVGQRPHGMAIDEARRLLLVSSENTGGAEPPHHFIEGATGVPGKLKAVNLQTFSVNRDFDTDLAIFPSSLVLIP